FVGRAQEIELLVQRLQQADCRLLSLVGPGGIGKTRLAWQVAQHLTKLGEAPFADGIYFVALAAVHTPTELVTAIAVALDLPLFGGADPEVQLCNYLQKRQICLILDNFEQLVDAGEVVATLLAAAPQLKLIITTREALNLQEEW